MRHPEELLRIDADAAARKLSEKRFKSPSDAVAALVRAVLDAAPLSVHVQLTRNRVEIRAEGGAVDGAVFRYAALLFNPAAGETERLKAIARLDDSSGAAFLAAFTEPYHRVWVEWRDASQRHALAFAHGKPPRSAHARSEDAVRITVEGKAAGTARISSVARYCRFSEVPIFINQMRVDRRGKMPGCSVQRSFSESGLRGTVGIPQEGELSSITRLENGIVVEESFYGERRGLVIDAAVEGASDLENRDILSRLRSVGRELYRDAAAQYSQLSAADRASLKERLTARYEYSFDHKLLEGLPLFVTAEGARVDFFEIKHRAAREAIFALDDEADASDYRTRRRFVLMLSAREKRFFQNALDLSFSEPPRRVSLLTAGHRINAQLRALRERLRGTPEILDEDALSAAEQHFLSRLSAHTGQWDEIVFVNERDLRTVQETDSGKRIFVPRHHPLTRTAIKRTEADPTLGPWALLLFTQGALPRSE